MDGSGRGRAAGAADRHCAAALLHISGGAQSLGRSSRLCPGPCLQPLLHAHARAQPKTPCRCWRSTHGHKGSGGLGSVEMVTCGCMHWIRRRPGRLLTCCAGRQRTHWRGGQERIAFNDSARLRRLSYDRSGDAGDSICGTRRWTSWRGPRGWRWWAATGRWRCPSWPPTARIRTPSSWSCRSPNDHPESWPLACAAAHANSYYACDAAGRTRAQYVGGAPQTGCAYFILIE